MRVLDICSGYSASTLGWAGLDMEHVGYAEVDAFPARLLAHHYGATKPMRMPDPDAPGLPYKERKLRAAMIKAVDRMPAGEWGDRMPNFGDFTQIGESDVGPVDLLVGGTPCQAFSIAGKRLGLDDPRGNLTLEFLALARRVRADWLVWENVPGFLSHDEGRTMGTFLWLLGELGYGFAWRVLDAQFIRVDGAERAVPQRRNRLFVVGHLGDAAGPAAVLFERESLRGDPAPRRETGQGVTHDVAPSLVSNGRGVERAGETRGQDPVVAEAFGGNNTAGPIDISTALNCHGRLDFESETFVAHALRADGFDASEDGTGRGTPIVPVVFDTTQITSPNNRSAAVPGAPCHPLAASAHPPAIAFPERLSATATASSEELAPRLGAINPTAIAIPAQQWAVRRLTPTEAERLMAVPDGFTAVTYRRKPAADGPRYKVLGNSQAANVMRWIGHGLKDVVAAQAEISATPREQE